VPDGETEPPYVAPTPTAPNEMWLRLTVPLIEYVPRGDESAIEPRSDPCACLQRIVNVPRCEPLYVPDHVPPSPADDDVAADAMEAVAHTARNAETKRT
jgi:hypothetical protein